MKTVLFILMLFATETTFSQHKDAPMSEKIDPNKPTIYLEYVCQDEKNIKLRLENNSIWYITIWTVKSYFPTSKPFTLRNGAKGYAIPNDEKVDMFYYVEKDKLWDNKKIKIPKKELPREGGGGEVISQDSVIFPVEISHLQKGLKVYVEFSYEWDGQGDISNEPSHRVYFRGGDIGSANTGIEPTLCKK